MEQHPIPQNVSSYQFKLVGDMTLKQFFQLAGGILVGIIFYSTPLLPIIRYPLALISILLGIGLAFLPFEERPLEKWIFAFFRAIYSPTVFNWRAGSVPEKLFQDEVPNTIVTPQDNALKDYLAKTDVTPAAHNNLEKAETGFLSKLTSIINTTPTPTFNPPVPAIDPTPQIPMTVPLNMPTPITQVQNPTPPLTRLPEPVLISAVPEQKQPEAQETGPKTLVIPQNAPVKIPAQTPHLVVEETSKGPVQASATPVPQVIRGNEMISTTQALFSVDAAPPNPPIFPNVVVGQVIDQDRKIVEGAIMEIRDVNGRPTRALRSNRVGHFITVTPLDNGHYEIITEKDGYEFAPINFEATGAVILPMLVQGKRLGPLPEAPNLSKKIYSIN